MGYRDALHFLGQRLLYNEPCCSLQMVSLLRVELKGGFGWRQPAILLISNARFEGNIIF